MRVAGVQVKTKFGKNKSHCVEILYTKSMLSCPCIVLNAVEKHLKASEICGAHRLNHALGVHPVYRHSISSYDNRTFFHGSTTAG